MKYEPYSVHDMLLLNLSYTPIDDGTIGMDVSSVCSPVEESLTYDSRTASKTHPGVNN